MVNAIISFNNNPIQIKVIDIDLTATNSAESNFHEDSKLLLVTYIKCKQKITTSVSKNLRRNTI